MDSYFVIAYAAIQRRVLDFCTLVRIDLRCLAGHPLQLFQYRAPLEHLLDSIWTQKVVVYIVQAVRVRTFVTLRPLLGIADSPDTAQIDSRHQISRILLLDQVRERQVRGIGMIHMTPHHQ